MVRAGTRECTFPFFLLKVTNIFVLRVSGNCDVGGLRTTVRDATMMYSQERYMENVPSFVSLLLPPFSSLFCFPSLSGPISSSYPPSSTLHLLNSSPASLHPPPSSELFQITIPHSKILCNVVVVRSFSEEAQQPFTLLNKS